MPHQFHEPTPKEIAAETAVYRVEWLPHDFDVRMSSAIQAQVELMTAILRPMAVAAGMTPESIEDRAERFEVERRREIGDAIDPLVRLLFDRRFHGGKRGPRRRLAS